MSILSPGLSEAKSVRILIADDTPSSRELLRSILETCAYEIAEAEDGEQVVAKAILFEPHIFILDLQMPRLSGYGAAAALRKLPAFEKTPIVALTAALSETQHKQIMEAGFTSFLVKPIGPSRLRQCVASLLEQVS